MLGLLILWMATAAEPIAWPQDPARRDILAAIVQQVVGSGPSTPVLIKEWAIVTAPLPIRSLPACGSTEARRQPSLPCGPSGFDSLPAGLLTSVGEADTVPRRWRPGDMPPNAQLLPEALRQTFLADGPTGFWPALQARFPEARLVTVSPLQIAADGLAAGATVMVRCGPRCGYVVYSVLERPLVTDPWRVTRWITALRF